MLRMTLHQAINARAREQRARAMRARYSGGSERLDAQIELDACTPLARVPYGSGAKPVPALHVSRAHANGRDTCRWIENVSRGWRVMGLAHEVCGRAVSHRGWYMDPDGMDGEVMVGIVIRLPAHKGHNRYLIGYADPYNADCALVDAELIETPRDASGESEDTANLARAADRFAERHADRERDYRAADNDVRRAREAMAEARKAVSECIAEVRGYREAGLANPAQYYRAMTNLGIAINDYREAASTAFEAADHAQRRHQITWQDCAP